MSASPCIIEFSTLKGFNEIVAIVISGANKKENSKSSAKIRLSLATFRLHFPWNNAYRRILVSVHRFADAFTRSNRAVSVCMCGICLWVAHFSVVCVFAFRTSHTLRGVHAVSVMVYVLALYVCKSVQCVECGCGDSESSILRRMTEPQECLWHNFIFNFNFDSHRFQHSHDHCVKGT